MNKEARIETLISEVAQLQTRLLTTFHADFPTIDNASPLKWPRRVEIVFEGVAWHGSLHGMGYRFESEDGRVIEAHDRIQASPYPIDGFRLAIYAQSCGIQGITLKDLPPVVPEPEELDDLLVLAQQAGIVERDKRVESFRAPRYLVVRSESADEPNQDEERLVGELRAAWARGDSPSALLRSLTSPGIVGAPVIVLMMRAFALTLSSTNAIAAWFSHADDKRLDRHLMPHMPARTPTGPTGEPAQ